jgi:hypothetical protein
MSGLTLTGADPVCIEDECRDTTLLVPFGDVWYDYILWHVELHGDMSA